MSRFREAISAVGVSAGAGGLVLATLIAFGSCGAPSPEVAPSDVEVAPSDSSDVATGGIAGAWRPGEYLLETGEVLPVDGRIYFLPDGDAGDRGEWMVLFYVTGEDGAPLRGSAEGGRYALAGTRLVLTHRYHLSAGDAVGSLSEAQLRMTLRSELEAAEHEEPCEVEISERQLTLFFPSGNSMTFVRVASG